MYSGEQYTLLETAVHELENAERILEQRELEQGMEEPEEQMVVSDVEELNGERHATNSKTTEKSGRRERLAGGVLKSVRGRCGGRPSRIKPTRKSESLEKGRAPTVPSSMRP